MISFFQTPISTCFCICFIFSFGYDCCLSCKQMCVCVLEREGLWRLVVAWQQEKVSWGLSYYCKLGFAMLWQCTRRFRLVGRLSSWKLILSDKRSGTLDSQQSPECKTYIAKVFLPQGSSRKSDSHSFWRNFVRLKLFIKICPLRSRKRADKILKPVSFRWDISVIYPMIILNIIVNYPI